ncbi:hypothetical protein C8E83_3056 [Frondihabitans australicus]|uniref:Antitoxin Xre/MbcA/ParS-like toxin-binding domain-containing protein n=2 Tax=Frondihabitans australicus TaxID=386892 RepID=A0A495IIP1_9MICO|nr:hypothetical protein C8E83_3056 [Frondihabitans australicus]
MAARLEAVNYVLARAEQVWAPQAIEGWLYGCNSVLDGVRPIDFVGSGRVQEIVQALEVARA